jgi:hypothetical protein
MGKVMALKADSRPAYVFKDGECGNKILSPFVQ